MTAVPQSLVLGTDAIHINVTQPVEFFNRGDYLLVEINPEKERVKIYQTRKLITQILNQGIKPIALRGYGFRGIPTVATIAHLIKTEEKGDWEFYFETFTAQPKKSEKQFTGLQIVMIPKLMIKSRK
ncbi:MAG: hypothetical protein ACFFDT_14100 [Candidatus Hodarchaeota archaeon]